ncbi:MAG: hypothetical protein JW959_01555 [Pirellulales bacterium]|nr:hypothetical protein [Pirellulales bacterium]
MRKRIVYVIFPIAASIWFVGCTGCEPAPRPEPEQTVESTPERTPAKTIETAAKKAAPGVGKKGRGYGQGVVATPIASMFAAEQKIIFLQIEHAEKLFKAEHGRMPKDHEEYMEKIIKANQIKLPELPEGERYRYDSEKEQLMVERLVKE